MTGTASLLFVRLCIIPNSSSFADDYVRDNHI